MTKQTPRKLATLAFLRDTFNERARFALASVRASLAQAIAIGEERGLIPGARVAALGIVNTVSSYVSASGNAPRILNVLLHVLAIVSYLCVLVLWRRGSSNFRFADRLLFSATTVGFPLLATVSFVTAPQAPLAALSMAMAPACLSLIYPATAVLAAWAAGTLGGLAVGVVAIVLNVAHPIFGWPSVFGVVVSTAVLLTMKVMADQNANDRDLAVKAITGTIVHEMRTPMASIEMSCQGLLDTFGRFVTKTLSPQQQEVLYTKISVQSMNAAIDRISADAERMTRELNFLLENASMRESLPADTTLVRSVGDLVQESIRAYPFYSREDRKLVNVTIEHDFPARVSKMSLDHVLINLMKNALHSIARAKKGQIDISVGYDAVNVKNYVRFRDTGLGIKKADLAKIFLPFYTTRINGTGLGLPFSRRQLALFGADISVNSVEGQFAEFTISFPTVDAQLDNATDLSPDDDHPG